MRSIGTWRLLPAPNAYANKRKNMELGIKIAGVEFTNPIWVASGTFGSGKEFEDFLDLSKVGAILTKTVTLDAREGNKPPRIVETPSGLLNSIGLENKGLEHFLKEIYPEIKGFGSQIVVSIAGRGEEEFIKCTEMLTGEHIPAAIEINLSCPNVVHKDTKYKLISQDPASTEKITRSVKEKAKCPVFAKLTPNVTDLTETARAAEAGGADAVALVNTYMAMSVNAQTMKPNIGNVAGGLSGPAIKPMALKAVWDVYNNITIPIIGIGGIMTGIDVAEFMLCGAQAVQVGTANLASCDAQNRILEQFEEYLEKMGMKTPAELVGKLQV